MGAKIIEIETAMFAAKIDGNRSILQKSQSTQHYLASRLVNDIGLS